MRSYAVILIFVGSRILLAIPGVAPTSDLGAVRMRRILSLSICVLLVPQVVINRRQLFAPDVR